MTRYKMAQASMRTAFKSYLESDEEVDEFGGPATRQEVLGGTLHEGGPLKPCLLILSIFTGDKGHKKICTSNELEFSSASLGEWQKLERQGIEPWAFHK